MELSNFNAVTCAKMADESSFLIKRITRHIIEGAKNFQHAIIYYLEFNPSEKLIEEVVKYYEDLGFEVKVTEEPETGDGVVVKNIYIKW